MYFKPVDFALIREAKNIVMGRGHEKIADKIFRFRARAHHSFAAAPLRAVSIDRQALDITGISDGHRRLLFGDQIFDGDILLLFDKLGAARIAEGFFTSSSSFTMIVRTLLSSARIDFNSAMNFIVSS